jgi:heme A synthase
MVAVFTQELLGIKMKLRNISIEKLALWALIGNVIVILQGAVVRATGSGAGCGSHWPTCNGVVVPLDHTVESIIEFSHRGLSGMVLLLGLLLLIRGWQERRGNRGFFVFASASAIFVIIEALLGAATVLLGFTGDHVSTGRGIMVAVHLVNSLLLVGVLTGTVVYSRSDRPRWPLQPGGQKLLSAVLTLGLAGMLLIMFSGGIAAMGTTMFPVDTLREGVAADFNPDSHLLVRLRILHPLISLAIGIYLFVALGLGWWLKPVPQARRMAQYLLTVYLVQLGVGLTNFVMMAPIVLQLLHLGLAVLSFGLLVALTVMALGYPAAETASGRQKTLSQMENA